MAQQQVSAFGTSYQLVYLSKWVFVYGADAALVYEQLQNGWADADYRQEVYFRTAEVTTAEPSGWTGTGNVRSGIATATTTFSFAASTSVAARWNGTSGKAMWIQFAVLAKSNTAATWAGSWSRLKISLDNKAKLVGGRKIQVQPNSNNQIVPLSRWIPGQDLTAAMAAFRISGAERNSHLAPGTPGIAEGSHHEPPAPAEDGRKRAIFGARAKLSRVSGGTLTYRLVTRSLLGPGSLPGAWGTIGTSLTTSVDVLFNTGDLSVTPGTNTSVQLGLQFSGTVVATLEVALAARYA